MAAGRRPPGDRRPPCRRRARPRRSWSPPAAARRPSTRSGPGWPPCRRSSTRGPGPRSATDAEDLLPLRNVIISSRVLMIVILLAAPCCCAGGSCCPCCGCGPGCGRWPAANIEEEVLIDGPPEVAAIGRDAESMRRRIVAELESARAATEALPSTARWSACCAASSPSHPPADAERPGGRRHGALGRGRAGRRLVGDGPPPRRQHRAGARRRVRARRRGRGGGVRASSSGSPRCWTPTSTSAVLRDRRPRAPTRTASGSCPAWWSSSTPRASGCRGSTPATRPRWSSTGTTATTRRAGPTGPLISSVTSGWTVGRTLFGPDDLLLACTDGVLEARDADGRELGVDGLLAVLRRLEPVDARGGGGRVPGGGAPVRGRRTPRRRHLRGAGPGTARRRPDRNPRSGSTPGHRWQWRRAAEPDHYQLARRDTSAR